MFDDACYLVNLTFALAPTDVQLQMLFHVWLNDANAKTKTIIVICDQRLTFIKIAVDV